MIAYSLCTMPFGNERFASMLSVMKDRHAADWEELARREPYFAVLTDEGLLGVEGNSVATAAFFETGEADIASLLGAITTLFGHDIPMTSVLDFGCGVGRLTLPLARRAAKVVACDVAPTMLLHARKNAEGAGIHNVTFVESGELAGFPRDSFDFVCSLLVFQHIPPTIGYGFIRTLLSLLAPGGIAALHTTFERPGGRIRRLARAMRARSQFVHRVVGIARGDRLRLPYMQMNEYDELAIDRGSEAANARIAGRFPTRHGDTNGAVLVIEKLAGPASA
jgi:2-polyprenyl-3-methyl-5-hydroxy-6-metoxy-1,4-benzoquinol methylase